MLSKSRLTSWFLRLWVSLAMSGTWLWVLNAFPWALSSDGSAHSFPWPPLPGCSMRSPKAPAWGSAWEAKGSWPSSLNLKWTRLIKEEAVPLFPGDSAPYGDTLYWQGELGWGWVWGQVQLSSHLASSEQGFSSSHGTVLAGELQGSVCPIPSSGFWDGFMGHFWWRGSSEYLHYFVDIGLD